MVHFIQIFTHRFNLAQHDPAVVRKRKKSPVAPAIRHDSDHLVGVAIPNDADSFGFEICQEFSSRSLPAQTISPSRIGPKLVYPADAHQPAAIQNYHVLAHPIDITKQVRR
jgi:hypothetical protein